MPAPAPSRTMHPLPPPGATTYWPAVMVVGSLLFAVGSIVFLPLTGLGILLMLGGGVAWVRQTWREDWTQEPPSRDVEGEPWWRERSKDFWGALAFMFVFWWFFSAAFRAGIAHGLFDPAELPPALADVNSPLAILATLLLAASAGTAFWSTRTLSEEGRERLPFALGVTVTLGALFLLWLFWEAGTLLDGGLSIELPVGSVFYWLLFLQALATLGGVLFLSVLTQRAQKGQFRKGGAGPVRAAALYWIYVVVLWGFIYATVYLKLITYESKLFSS